MSSNNSFKNKVTHKLFAYKYIWKLDLALTTPQGLSGIKNQPTNQKEREKKAKNIDDWEKEKKINKSKREISKAENNRKREEIDNG